MLVHELIFRGKNDTLAIIEGQQQITYQQLQEKTAAYRDFFYSIGIRYADNVALCSRNCQEYIYAYMALNSLGAVAVPINFQLSPREISYIIKDAGIQFFITHKKLDFTIGGKDSIGSALQQILLADIDAQPGQQPPAPALPADFSEENTGAIIYTSGTTGTPKGAVLSHKNLTRDAVMFQKFLQVKPTDNILCVLPMYHCFSWTCAVINPLYAGACITILAAFSPKECLDTIRERQISILYAVPSICSLIAKLGRKEDLQSLRITVLGGASLPLQIARDFKEKFGIAICEGYGLSEAAPVCAVNPPGREKLGSIGLPLPGIQAKIIDSDSNPLPPGQPGELCLAGDNVMKGYWNLPEDTAAALKDGWLHTGDIAMQDDEGYLFIVDRIKDMIISMGENIYPREIEELLYAYNGIAEAAVVGVPDKLRGQSGICFFVAEPGAEVIIRDLKKYLQANLALYKLPREYKQLSELPKTGTGKISKRELAEAYKKK
jgi:long-chain acyl-CoA synthetase